MNAGAYRERIRIERSTCESDFIGNHKQVWSAYYAGYAYVNKLFGSEYWEAAGVNAQETLQFVMRWHPLLNAVNSTQYRLIWHGEAYNITSVDNVQYRNETVKIRGERIGNESIN